MNIINVHFNYNLIIFKIKTNIMATTSVYVAKDQDSINKGAHPTLKEAYEAAKPNCRIKFAPDVYCESITIRKPGIVLEPIEKSLVVTLR